MSKHTPSPWVADSPPGIGGWWIVRDASGQELGSGGGGFDEADARLIAAAPELLSALKRLAACYETSNSPQVRADCWAQARAAIAKAEGTE